MTSDGYVKKSDAESALLALKRGFRRIDEKCAIGACILEIQDLPTVEAVEVKHGERLYNAHEVAVIIADLFGDDCACNFNSINEWLPFKCELQDACPNPVGVACWEQYLKYRGAEDGN